jgi:D-alanyl-D-alanine carboxypeptidase (penicillin-binding protein 5/6)
MTSRGPGTGRTGRPLAAALAIAAIALPAAATAQAPAPQDGESGPAPTPAAPSEPKLAARAWILVDPRDDSVLAAKGAHRRLSIASVTKLMTAHLALEELRPRQRLVAPRYDAGPIESVIGLRAGEKMTVRDLLYGLILESGNDAAATLATGVAGSVPAFVQRMNREAESLGLRDTSYANPIGLDDPANFSSAADQVKLAELLLAEPLFARIADTEVVTLRSGDRPRRFDTRNTLLGLDPTVDGVKTGHTLDAGYVLVGSATRNGTRLISAVLGAGSEAARDAETEELIDYGFSLYRRSEPVARGEELADPELDFRDERLPLLAKRTIAVSTREGQAVDVEVEAPEEISGEIREGETLGQVTVSVDGAPVASSALQAARAADAASIVDKVTATAQNPIFLLPAGGIVIVVGVLLAARGRRRRDGVLEPAEPPRPREPRPVRNRTSEERTPEERRKMHEERMRRRRQRSGDEQG